MKGPLTLLAFGAIALTAIAAHPFSFWKSGATPPPSGTPPPSPATHPFSYVSDGDTNGVFYFAGQNYTSGGTWTNPHTSGRITVSASNLASGTLASVVDRVASDAYCGQQADNFFQWDLGAGRALTVSNYSYRGRSGGTLSIPTGFILRGSNDGSSWTDLDTRSGLTITQNQWYTAAISGTPAAYRHFRLVRNGLDNAGGTFLTIGEFELYGTLTY